MIVLKISVLLKAKNKSFNLQIVQHNSPKAHLHFNLHIDHSANKTSLKFNIQ